jgi:hypothetical protein
MTTTGSIGIIELTPALYGTFATSGNVVLTPVHAFLGTFSKMIFLLAHRGPGTAYFFVASHGRCYAAWLRSLSPSPRCHRHCRSRAVDAVRLGSTPSISELPHPPSSAAQRQQSHHALRSTHSPLLRCRAPRRCHRASAGRQGSSLLDNPPLSADSARLRC